jgi:hypothetical protein
MEFMLRFSARCPHLNDRIRINNLKNPTGNTDNKGHLFVTFFAPDSYRQAKTTPYPPCLPPACPAYRQAGGRQGRQPCTVILRFAQDFLAKVPGPCPDAASGNTTSPYCRAVRLSKNLSLVLITLVIMSLAGNRSFVP